MSRRKWIKRTLLSIAFVLALTAGVSYWAFKGTPEYYQRRAMSEQERADAAERARRKIFRTQEWVAQLRADAQRAVHAASTGAPPPSATTRSSQPFSVSFTEEELNAGFETWSKAFGWDVRYARYISDPRIVLRKDRLILAGTVPDVGTVASFHFEPTIDAQGQLVLTLRRVYAGRLPMPDLMWTSQRERLLSAIRQRLPAWQRGATMAPNGDPNRDAMMAAASNLLLAVMNDQPGDPSIFVWDPANKAATPVRLTEVRLADEELTLTAEPMTAAEREAMLERIRAPESSATPLAR